MRPIPWGLAALALAACVAVPTEPQGADPSATVAAGDPDEMICEVEPVAGSMIPRKVCLTRRERERHSRDASDAVADGQRRALNSCAAGAGCGGG